MDSKRNLLETGRNANKPALLEVKDLKTYFYMSRNRIAKAVDGVSFSIQENETVAIVGESGSGKSVTALSILNLIPNPPGEIIEGTIQLHGKDLLELSKREINKVRGEEVGMIFQEPMTSLNPVFTIGNQVAETLIKHQQYRKKAAYKKAVELLETVGIPRADEIIKAYPHQLSGGMRQRVMIAMAMSSSPKLLIADEPTTALDVTTQAQILDLMLDMKQAYHSSILLITHDLGVVAETAERVIVMYGGQVVEEASAEDLFNDPLHPYTKALLESVPDLEEDQDRLTAIPGKVPPAHDFPKGCRFAPRCPFVMDKCLAIHPELENITARQKVRCHLYEGEK